MTSTPTNDFGTFKRPLVLAVPGAPRAPKTSLIGSMILVYGEPKIGKTTFAASAPGAWIVATEPGQDWVELREPTHISSWDDWIKLQAYITRTKPRSFQDGAPIQTLVIDRFDALFRMAETHVRSGLGVEALDELAHGKGWSRLTTAFHESMNAVRTWPYTLIGICHTRQREFKNRDKAKSFDKFEPDIGAAGLRWAIGAADLMLYAYSKTVNILDAKGEPSGKQVDKRFFRCHPSQTVAAGGRMAHLLPPEIPLGTFQDLENLIKTPQTLPKKTIAPTTRKAPNVDVVA